jgi:type IV pilus assembly protein PilQ
MRISQISMLAMRAAQTVLALLLCVLAPAAFAQAALQDVSFASLSGEQFEIRLSFNQAPPQPEVFTLDQPARLTLDFANVKSALSQRRFPLNFALAESVMVLEAQGRTRMVVNLNQSAPYQTEVLGNVLRVVVGSGGLTNNQNVVPLTSESSNTATEKFIAPASNGHDINGVDFRLGPNKSGLVVVDLANPNVSATVSQNGTRLLVEFANAVINQDEQVRLDVTDFGTPVQGVSMYLKDGKVVVQADVTGEYEYLAYQSADEYTLTVTPVAAAQSGTLTGPRKPPDYSGERISLNFQNIEVRALLQILADFNDFNLIVGDNVSGSMSVRLDNVPWDQALDMVLRTRGLGQRREGTVLYIAPAAEITTAEKQELESNQQVVALAPLVTEYIEVNYANASDLVTLLQSVGADASGGVLTQRGRASVDKRTNTLIVQDVESVLGDVRALVTKLDVPVKQVLIEARIVNASTNFSEALGIRWGGGGYTTSHGGDALLLSGSLASNTALGEGISEFNQAVFKGEVEGKTLAQAVAGATLPTVKFNDALAVDLGLDASSGSIALGYAGNSGLLQLELSALEDSGNGEVIAQPKITTQDQQIANISSGVKIPYLAQAGGTAGGTTTQFIDAVLQLEVTPQITPDGRIIMQLRITQDSVRESSGGGAPAISTNSIDTRVLVNNGDTVVLGGVFREEVLTSVTKTPLLGDIPYLGNLFKRTKDSSSKTELLIFITPSIINELVR